MRVGVLTISDSVFGGEAEDWSGLAICDVLGSSELTADLVQATVPDDLDKITDLLRQWVDDHELDVILTTGGTGLGPRDVTPEATLAVVMIRVPGIEEALREQGRLKIPTAMLSRGIAGIRNQTLIVNLPGSPGGAREGADLLVPVLGHAVDLLHGKTKHGQDARAG
jgi:molybdenum cofactor synthesis domain-containing protein